MVGVSAIFKINRYQHLYLSALQLSLYLVVVVLVLVTVSFELDLNTSASADELGLLRLGFSLFGLGLMLWLLVGISGQIANRVRIARILRRRVYLVGGTKLPFKTWIRRSAVSEELRGQYDKRPELISSLLYQQDNWRISDVTPLVGKERALKSRGFYTVFEAKLPRVVPHLIFDSHQAKGQQFERLFLQSQRLPGLAVGFDEYFKGYSPQGYQLDTLSFITPEVIEALTALKAYDIEFVANSLFCYAPLLPQAELADFRKKARQLWAKVNHNLANYKDDRLTGLARHNDVTRFASSLLKNPWRWRGLIILTGSVSLLIVSLTVYYDNREILLHQSSTVCLFTFIASLIHALLVRRANKRKEANFNSFLRHTNKPTVK